VCDRSINDSNHNQFREFIYLCTAICLTRVRRILRKSLRTIIHNLMYVEIYVKVYVQLYIILCNPSLPISLLGVLMLSCDISKSAFIVFRRSKVHLFVGSFNLSSTSFVPTSDARPFLMQREGVYLLSTIGVGLRFTYGTCSLSVLGVLQ